MKHFCLRKKLRSHDVSGTLPVSDNDMPETLPDPTALFAKISAQATTYGEELTEAITANMRQGELAELAALWEMIPFYTGVINTAKFATREAKAKQTLPQDGQSSGLPDYIISSRFLTECHNYLVADPNRFERMHLVTGIALGGSRYTLDQMAHVALSMQTRSGAKADQNSLRQALIEMDMYGHHLHGLFHSHPGSGTGATYPSNIDLTTHMRHEDGDYPLIGAIFVPGYVRFFSAHQPFTVSMYGKGVTPVQGEKNVYKIQIPSISRDVSYQTTAAQE